MAFVDNGDEELDYEDEDLLETGGPPAALDHPAMRGLDNITEEELEDEDFEDLYGDVNVGIFQAPQPGRAAAFRGSAQNGVPSYGEVDSGNEEEYPIAEEGEEHKPDLHEIREEGFASGRTTGPSSMRPQEGGMQFNTEYAPRGKPEGEVDVGLTSLKPKEEVEQAGRPGSALKTGKSTGPNGTTSIEGGVGRGAPTRVWPPSAGTSGEASELYLL